MERVTYDDLDPLVAALRAGQTVAIPTDTVYGVACAAHLRESCEWLLRAKGRSLAQPSAIVAGSRALGDRRRAARAERRRRRPPPHGCCPGPLTLIVPNPGRRYAWLCGDQPNRIGLRVPVLHPLLAAAIDRVPALLLTSANVAGEPPAVTFDDLGPVRGDRHRRARRRRLSGRHAVDGGRRHRRRPGDRARGSRLARRAARAAGSERRPRPAPSTRCCCCCPGFGRLAPAPARAAGRCRPRPGRRRSPPASRCTASLLLAAFAPAPAAVEHRRRRRRDRRRRARRGRRAAGRLERCATHVAVPRHRPRGRAAPAGACGRSAATRRTTSAASAACSRSTGSTSSRMPELVDGSNHPGYYVPLPHAVVAESAWITGASPTEAYRASLVDARPAGRRWSPAPLVWSLLHDRPLAVAGCAIAAAAGLAGVREWSFIADPPSLATQLAVAGARDPRRRVLARALPLRAGGRRGAVRSRSP